MTFSVVAFDKENKTWAVGATTRFLAVGGILPWVEYGVGAIASQAAANMSYGRDGLSLLRNGASASQVIRMLTAGDENREIRQLSVIDSQGRIDTFTGRSCVDFAGHMVSDSFSVQGNMLKERAVVESVFEEMKTSKEPLPERIIDALAAGETAGGDKRGKQSACIVVVGDADPVFNRSGFVDPTRTNVNLRVDDSPEPVKELRRIYNLWTDMFSEDEMVPLKENEAAIRSALEIRGYKSLDAWSFDNNYGGKILEGRISKRVLEILLEKK